MAAGFEEFESSKVLAAQALQGQRSAQDVFVPDSGRYVSRRAAQPRNEVPPEQTSGEELYARSAATARSGNDEVAQFVMMDAPAKLSRLNRAVRDEDVELAGRLVSEIDGFLDEHYNGVAEWTSIARAGKAGQERAAVIGSLLDGTYKNRARELLEGESDEYKARKASRLSKELSVSSGVARAIFDRDDPLHSTYSRFLDLASPASSGGAGSPVVPGKMTRDSKLDFLHGIARLDTVLGQSFAGTEPGNSLASFVSAFDQAVNKDGQYAGDAVLEKVARGYLDGKHGMTAHDYVSQYGALVDRLSSQASGGQTAKGATELERRMTRSEANEIASEFVSLQDQVTGEVNLGPEWASAIESAASTVRMANDMFGAVARGGAGYARNVAAAALVSMGVPGVDDGGLLRRVSDAASDLSTLVSAPTRDLMKTMADGKGQAHVGTVKAVNPYSNVEMFAVKALGRAVSGLSEGVDGAMPQGQGWGALKRFAAGNETARTRLKRAMADAIDTRFGERELSLRVANTMVDRFLGLSDDGRTIEELVRGYTGKFDPVTDRPKIPDGVRMTDTMPDGDFNGVLARMAGDPDSVIPSMKGDRARPLALKHFATATLDRISQGRAKDPDKTSQGEYLEKSIAWRRSLGRLADAAGVYDAGGLLANGILGNSTKALQLTSRDQIDYWNNLQGGLDIVLADAEKGDIDAALSLAIVSRADPWKRVSGVYTRDFPVRQYDDRIHQILSQFGVGRNFDLPTAMKTLSSRTGFAEESTLVSSGLVDPATGTLSYKRLLSTLQRSAYADRYVDPKDDPTPLQEAARRVYRSFGSRDDVIAKLKSDALEHYRANGAEGAELVRLDHIVSDRLSDVYRNGGPLAAEALSRKLMKSARRFFPVIDPKSKSVVPDAVVVSDIMDDDEYEAEWRRRQSEEAGRGVTVPESAYFDANARGLATWRHNVSKAERIYVGQQMHVKPPSEE